MLGLARKEEVALEDMAEDLEELDTQYTLNSKGMGILVVADILSEITTLAIVASTQIESIMHK
jgi:hypothetical protein